ncbi:hypothetical protein C3486_28135 [Streptomyces sp. Ru73]|uniref:hypothetical protein n=1 Tax=Streptomyces sp. Ru73 TaxID=2080748 RepID=UPI000CDDCA1F|nr:hypothetical protein [Streptomyces sp. Ru73]POX37464.1 hypothetical protein C3486_28135 [Streptomyces sp. Ru73]
MTGTELRPYEGREFRIALPAHWETVEPPGPPVALIAVEPGDGAAFRTNVVVTAEDVADAGADQWQRTVGRALAGHLQDYLLLDEQPAGTGTRRLFHHVLPEAGAITAEQWAWTAGGRGFTVTASAATFAYDALADLFAAVVEHFRIRGGDGTA